MNTLTNPRWLFLVNTLPFLIFSWLAYRQYTLIESLLEAENKSGWLIFAVVTALYAGSSFGVAVYLDTVKRRVLPYVLSGIFVAGIAYLSFGVNIMDNLVPWGIPRWLGGEDLMLYLFTFAMPTLGYGLLTGVQLSLERDKKPVVWKNFLIALAMPVAAYVFVMGIVPMMGRHGNLDTHLGVLFFAVNAVIFLFYLVRGIYLLILRRAAISEESRRFLLVLLSIAAPIGGLSLNFAMDNCFGNFSQPVWFLLAGFNGLLLCLPAYDNKLYRFYLFLGRTLLMAFILYFFTVFLPYLPLSIVAILFLGTGFLMLTPLLLLPVQITAIRDDYRYLLRYFRPSFLRVMGVMAFLMIPVFITVTYVRDKHVLSSALDYVYSPGQIPTDTFAEEIRPAALSRVLAVVDEHKGRRNDFEFGSGVPYLSSYYRWIVLDNLTISDAKMNEMRRIFLGEAEVEDTNFFRRNNTDVTLTSTNVQTEWDPKQEAWSSWVELELTRDSLRPGRGEYHTEFTMPPGVFIADYYLDVEGRREYGIQAEKRAATWVYNNIVNTNRDPGFLRYVSSDRVALNIFPFRRGETRSTGIRFLHKEPLTLPFAGRELTLGRVGEHPVSGPIWSPDKHTRYIPSADVRALPQVQRKLGVHFVVDASRQSPDTEEELIARINAFASLLPEGSPTPRITLAGPYPKTINYKEDWPAELRQARPGGFFAQRAVENILADQIANPSDTDYQIVLALHGSALPIFTDDFSAYAAAMPEGDDFYYLEVDGTLSLHRLTDRPARHLQNSVSLSAPPPVLAYSNAGQPTHYFPAIPGPVVITLPLPKGTEFKETTLSELPVNTWASGLALRGQYLTNQRAGATGYRPWLSEVRGSFHASILMPTTGFLVVENEAQKEALRRKQAETLSADPNLDLSEDQVQRMSEPWWVWVVGLLVFVVAAARSNWGM